MEKYFGRLKRVVDSNKLPLIEIIGNRRVLIENHLGVVEYGSNRIVIRKHEGSISITGKELQLTIITNERVVIKGEVESVGLDGGT